MFCKECGRNIGTEKICPYCRAVNDDAAFGQYSFAEYLERNRPIEESRIGLHSRLTAGVLQIFLGAFGLGRFYLGYHKIGVLQIVATVVTCGVGGLVWGLADGIMILCGTPKRDAAGDFLTE